VAAIRSQAVLRSLSLRACPSSTSRRKKLASGADRSSAITKLSVVEGVRLRLPSITWCNNEGDFCEGDAEEGEGDEEGEADGEQAP
jgi:hypothetical protein